LGLRTADGANFHRPIHVGYGLTQVLPILVAALSTPKNGIILVENPEVHLHPAGQALMGQFLADVASAGIQVIMETHSDHVLNGVRRSVKRRSIAPHQVMVHFFRPRSTSEPQVVSPALDSQGNLDSWPDGFFDQFDKDMNYFAGWDA
jgi:predicted ATPase